MHKQDTVVTVASDAFDKEPRLPHTTYESAGRWRGVKLNMICNPKGVNPRAIAVPATGTIVCRNRPSESVLKNTTLTEHEGLIQSVGGSQQGMPRRVIAAPPMETSLVSGTLNPVLDGHIAYDPSALEEKDGRELPKLLVLLWLTTTMGNVCVDDTTLFCDNGGLYGELVKRYMKFDADMLKADARSVLRLCDGAIVTRSIPGARPVSMYHVVTPHEAIYAFRLKRGSLTDKLPVEYASKRVPNVCTKCNRVAFSGIPSQPDKMAAVRACAEMLEGEGIGRVCPKSTTGEMCITLLAPNQAKMTVYPHTELLGS